MSKKNVIVIVTDDQGYGDLSIHNNPWLETPNYDMLCNDGVSLESFHTDPLCAPARAGFMTGRYSFGAGVISTINGRYYLRQGVPTIAESFKEGGYATAIFGKWHLGDSYPYRPHDRGFDEAVYFSGGSIGETPDYWNNDYFDDTYTVNGEPKKFDGYCTDNWFDCAMDFMKKQTEKETPFFCYLPLNAPHEPLNVEKKYYQKYLDKGVEEQRARFYGLIANVDENIGRLVQYLKDVDQYDNTVIVYFGDNGSKFGCQVDGHAHVISGYNAGMRGKKGTTYEGAHRNACFITSPGGVLGQPRQIYGTTAHMDIFPTCMDICGLKKPEGMDGISMYDALSRGETHINQGRTLVVHNMQRDMPQKNKDFTIIRDNIRVVRPLTPESNPIGCNNHIRGQETPPEVYDISKDIGQINDIYRNNVELANELVTYYREWYDLRVDEASKFSPIYITKKHPVKMTCHAWHESVRLTYTQGQLREGIFDTGYWALKVEDAGEYYIELRRYPRDSGGLKLSDPCDAIPKTDSTEAVSAGIAIPIISASILIDGKRTECKIDESGEFAKVKIYLPEGEYNLRSRFMLDDGRGISAYYAYVSAEDEYFI